MPESAYGDLSSNIYQLTLLLGPSSVLLKAKEWESPSLPEDLLPGPKPST